MSDVKKNKRIKQERERDRVDKKKKSRVISLLEGKKTSGFGAKGLFGNLPLSWQFMRKKCLAV